MDKELLKLSENDFNMVLEGLEALKSKDLTGELMGDMFTAMLSKKESEMTEQELQEHRKRQEQRAQEKQLKEAKKKAFNKEIDVLKAKITLLVEMNRPVKEPALLSER